MFQGFTTAVKPVWIIIDVGFMGFQLLSFYINTALKITLEGL